MQAVVMEPVRVSEGRGLTVAREMENSGWKGRYQEDKVIARMTGSACNGKTGKTGCS